MRPSLSASATPFGAYLPELERQLREATAQVTRGEGYLISCLYNAPLDCMARSRCR